MPTTDRKLRVFLCHASQDKPIVRELYQRLLAEGWIDPWLDEEKLLPGMGWDLEIEKTVEAADAVIVCLSNNSVTKEGYVQRELKFVLDIALEKPEGTIFVIPLRLEVCELPRRLRSWQYVDYFPEVIRKDALDKILVSLKQRALSAKFRIIADNISVTHDAKPFILERDIIKKENEGKNPSIRKESIVSITPILVFGFVSTAMLISGSTYYWSYLTSGEKELNFSGSVGASLCLLSALIAFLSVTVGIVRYIARKNGYTLIGLIVAVGFLVFDCIVIMLMFFQTIN